MLTKLEGTYKLLMCNTLHQWKDSMMQCHIMPTGNFLQCVPHTHNALLLQMNGKDLPFLPPKKGRNYIVPSGIRPVMQRTAIEVSPITE